MTLILSLLIVTTLYTIVVICERKRDRDLAKRRQARREMYVVEDSEMLS